MTKILCLAGPRKGTSNAGSAAVEFAITAPLLVLLALGAADYGVVTAQSSSLAAYTRAGADYARSQVASGNRLPSASTLRNVLNIPSGVSITFSATDPYCTCADGTSVTCPSQSSTNPCVAKRMPGSLNMCRSR
jgi:Flp pilus assembly protein TadG